jgi:hypothetical protein
VQRASDEASGRGQALLGMGPEGSQEIDWSHRGLTETTATSQMSSSVPYPSYSYSRPIPCVRCRRCNRWNPEHISILPINRVGESEKTVHIEDGRYSRPNLKHQVANTEPRAPITKVQISNSTRTTSTSRRSTLSTSSRGSMFLGNFSAPCSHLQEIRASLTACYPALRADSRRSRGCGTRGTGKNAKCDERTH